MLIRLLKLLSDTRGLASTPEVAHSLGLSEKLARETIDRAVALGYLALLQPDCRKAPCYICRERNSCLLQNSLKVWSITDEGERLLAERPSLETPAALER